MSKYLLFAIFVLLAVMALMLISYLLKGLHTKKKVTENNDDIDEKLFETINLSINDINNENTEPKENNEPLYNKDDIVYTESTDNNKVEDKTIEIEINSANS